MIRQMIADDCFALAQIQNEIFGHGSATEWQKNFLDDNYRTLVCFDGEKIVGFLNLLVVDDFAEIIEVGVLPLFRGRGFAKKLLDAGAKLSLKLGKVGYHLEVRESNNRAIEIYFKYGFQKIFVRKKYYEGKEDAIIMQLKF